VPLDQRRAPLFEALRHYAQQVRAPLHVPGHKQGLGAPRSMREFFGQQILSIDLTEAPGLDDLHAPTGVIAEAQELAAEAFGAAHSFFLVGGTTAGLHGLIMSACRPGQSLAVPRHAHRSVLGALILSGAKPAWVRTCLHAELDLAAHMDLGSLRRALTGASAALLVHPTYFGTIGSLAAEIDLIHQRNLPVIVDEAHGSHFHFHPDLPPSALSYGADGVVHSVHKTGGSLTQSSICHLGSQSRIPADRLKEMLRLVQSTSPSYLLMASLDLARRELRISGHEAWERALQLAETARTKLAKIPGIMICQTADPTKLLIDVRGRGRTGLSAAAHLWASGVAVETAGLGYILAVLTPGDRLQTVEHLVAALKSLPPGDEQPIRVPEPPWPEVVLTPREAFLGQKAAIPLAEAVGCIAAELISPYPPGIPVVAPGERLTPEVIGYLQHAVGAGYHLQGPADPHLRTIQVVRE
jgi:arginine decarboxylase